MNTQILNTDTATDTGAGVGVCVCVGAVSEQEVLLQVQAQGKRRYWQMYRCSAVAPGGTAPQIFHDCDACT